MKKLNLKDWRDLERQEAKATFREVRKVGSLIFTTSKIILFSLEVMQELLSGVKLRKVEPPPQSVPSLSCHEVLMRQIKARKVVLKPPVLPAEGERERSAREEIMDFIKSRPRLRPVVERKLARSPPLQEESQVERLLNEIRGGKARQSLRRARTRPRLAASSLVQSLEQLAVSGAAGRKKTIEPGADFQSLIYNFEEESPNTSSDEDSVFVKCGEEKEAEDQEATGAPPAEKKSLTLEELSTIRSKLARAQLELKDLSSEARLALEDGRVCFSCQKTRFSWFSWAHHCKICHRAVCKACCVKLRLPTSTWTEVKVSSLSTSLGITELAPPESRTANPFSRSGRNLSSDSYL